MIALRMAFQQEQLRRVYEHLTCCHVAAASRPGPDVNT